MVRFFALKSRALYITYFRINSERKNDAYLHIDNSNFGRGVHASWFKWFGAKGCSFVRYVVLACHLENWPWRYAATWIIGFYGSSLAIVYAYNASNTSGHTKKVTVNAMTLATFGLGNIIGTEIFQPKDAPDYLPGKISILVLLTTQLFVCLLLRWINLHLNKKKRAVVARLKERNGWSDEDVQREREKHAFLDLTDKQCVVDIILVMMLIPGCIYRNPYFVYTA